MGGVWYNGDMVWKLLNKTLLPRQSFRGRVGFLRAPKYGAPMASTTRRLCTAAPKMVTPMWRVYLYILFALALVVGFGLVSVALPEKYVPEAKAAITGNCNSTAGEDCALVGEIGKKGEDGLKGGNGGRGGAGGWAYVNCASEVHSGSTRGLKGLNGQKVSGINGGAGAYGGNSGSESGWVAANCGDGGSGGRGGNAGQAGATGFIGNDKFGAGGGGGGGGGASAPHRGTQAPHPVLQKDLANGANFENLKVQSGDGNAGGKGGDGGSKGLAGGSGNYLETRSDSGSNDGFQQCKEANSWRQLPNFWILIGVDKTGCWFPDISDTSPDRTGSEATFFSGVNLAETTFSICGAQSGPGSLKPCNDDSWTIYHVNTAAGGGRLYTAGTGAGGGGGGGGNGGNGGNASPGQNVVLTSATSSIASSETVSFISSNNNNQVGAPGKGEDVAPGEGGAGGKGASSGGWITEAGWATPPGDGRDGAAGVGGAPSNGGSVKVDLKGTLKTCSLNVQKKQSPLSVHIGKLTAKDSCDTLVISVNNTTDFNDIIIDELVANKPISILNSGGKLRIGKLTFDMNSSVPIPGISTPGNVQIGAYNFTELTPTLTYPVVYNAATDNRIDTEDVQYLTLSVARAVDIVQGKKVTLTDRETGYTYTYSMLGTESFTPAGEAFQVNIPIQSFMPANTNSPPFPSQMPYLAYNTRYQVGIDQLFRVRANETVYQRYSRATPNIGEFRTAKAPAGSIILSPKNSPTNASAVDVAINACQEFTAKVNVAPGLDKSVTWEIYGADSVNTKFTSQTPTNPTTNIATATLCVDNDETSQTLFIKGNLSADESVYDFSVVAIKGSVPTSVEIIDPASKSRTNPDPNATDAWTVQVRVQIRDGIVSAPFNASKFISWSTLSDVTPHGVTISNNGICTHEEGSVVYICPVTFNYVKPATPPSSVIFKVASLYDPSKSDALQYILQSNAAIPGNFSVDPQGPTVDLSRLTVENYALQGLKALNGAPAASCTKLNWQIVGNTSADTKLQANDGTATSSTWGQEVFLQVAKNENSAAITVKAICSGGTTDGKFAVTTVNVIAPQASLQIAPKVINFNYANYTSGTGICTSTPATTCTKIGAGDDAGNVDITVTQNSIFRPGVETGTHWEVLGAKSASTRFFSEFTGEDAGNSQEPGHLIVGADETASALFVVAKLKADGGKVDYATVRLSGQLQPNLAVRDGANIEARTQVAVDMSTGFTVPGVETQCTLGASDGVTYKKMVYSAVVQFPFGAKQTDKVVRASLMGGGYNTYANQPPIPNSAALPGYNHEFTGVVCISEFEAAQTLLLSLELSSYPSATAYITINLQGKTSNSIRIDCLSTPDCDVNMQAPATLTKDFAARLSLPGNGADYFTEWSVLGGIADTQIAKTSADDTNISTSTLYIAPGETASTLYVTAKSRATGVTDLYTIQVTNSKSLGVRLVGANNSAPPNQAMPGSAVRVFAKVNVDPFRSRNVKWELLGNVTDTAVTPTGSEPGTGNFIGTVNVGQSENADTIWVLARLESDPQIMDIIAISVFGDRSRPQLQIVPPEQNVDLQAVDYRTCASQPLTPECNKEAEFTASFNLPSRYYCNQDTAEDPNACRDENRDVNDVEWSLVGGVETTPVYNGVQIPHSRILGTGFTSANMPTVRVGVSPAETANILWVIAKSNRFEGIVAIGKLTITGKWTTGVLIEPGNTCINIDAASSTSDGCFHSSNNSIDFNAFTAVPYGAVDTVSWEIMGGTQQLEYGDPDCGVVQVTCITPEGKLYVSPSESSNFLYVRARLDYNPLLYDRVRVDIFGQHTQGVWMVPEKWYDDPDPTKFDVYDSVWNVCIDALSYDCVGTGTQENPAPQSRCQKAAASELPCRFGEESEDGTAYTYKVNANIIVPEGEANHDLAWEVYGATQETKISALSFAGENVPNLDGSYRRQATLSINPNETASIITVVARALYDPSRFDTLTIHIYGRNSAGLAISPRLTNVEVGGRIPFTTEVDVPNGESSQVIYSLVGANDTTEITDEGVLIVSPFETSASLTVVVTSVYDPSIFDYATVIITGRKTSGVLISPQSPVFEAGSSNFLHARVTSPPHLDTHNALGAPASEVLQARAASLRSKYPDCVYSSVVSQAGSTHCYNDDVSWKVLGGVSDTSIDPRSGELKISPQEVNPTLVVVAIADDDHSLKDAVVVEVSGRDGGAVRIDQRGDEVNVGTSVNMTAQVSVPEGHSRELVWSIFGNSSKDTTIDSSGLLTLAADETSTNVAVIAQLKEETSQFDVSHIVPTEHLITTLKITPHEISAKRGEVAELTTEIKVPANRAQSVDWSVSGSASEQTSIADGKLMLADDEASSVLSVQACLSDFPQICDHAIVYVDSANRLGYLKSTQEHVKEALGQISSSVFSTSVWPVYQKNSNQVISLSVQGDAREVESISVDGKKIDSVQYNFGGVSDFGVNYQRDEQGNPVISALGSMFAVSIANAATSNDAGSNSDATSGKTQAKVVIFNPAFLETLETGEHSVEVAYKGSSESKGFRIVGADDVITQHAFGVQYLLLVILLFVALAIYLVKTRIVRPSAAKLDALAQSIPLADMQNAQSAGQYRQEV